MWAVLYLDYHSASTCAYSVGLYSFYLLAEKNCHNFVFLLNKKKEKEKKEFQQHYKIVCLCFLFIYTTLPLNLSGDNRGAQGCRRPLVRIQGWSSSSGTISYKLSPVLIGRSGALHINGEWFSGPRNSTHLLPTITKQACWLAKKSE